MLAGYRSLLLVHVAFGFIGLVAFWFPVLSRKGGPVHTKAGKVFMYSAYIVGGTAIAIALMRLVSPFGIRPDDRPSDPAAVGEALLTSRMFAVFLAYLGVITVASVHHGIGAMRARGNTAQLNTPLHTALNVSAVVSSAVVLALGIIFGQVLLLALSPLGVFVGWGGLRYAGRPRPTRMAHWYEHMGGMFGGGIAFHTAFAVFGIQRFIDYQAEGIVGILPWVLPGIVGAVGSAIWQRHYRRRFGELRRAVAPSHG